MERLIDEGKLILALAVKKSLKRRAINDAIDEYELRAVTSVEREVSVRVAADADDLYIDIGDRDWRAIRITGVGWSLVQSPPVRFRRTSGTLPLPFPERASQSMLCGLS